MRGEVPDAGSDGERRVVQASSEEEEAEIRRLCRADHAVSPGVEQSPDQVVAEPAAATPFAQKSLKELQHSLGGIGDPVDRVRLKATVNEGLSPVPELLTAIEAEDAGDDVHRKLFR